jgi:O-acetylserine/cysteine efflux transporter
MAVRHILLALLVMALWGFSFVMMGHALEAFSPILVAFLRIVVAATPVLILWRRPPIRWPVLLGISATLGFLQHAMVYIGIDLGVPAGIASLLVQSQVFFTTLFAAILLGERPKRLHYLGMALAAGGMVLIASTLGAGGPLIGFAMVIVAAVGWAVANILVKQAKTTDLLRLIAWIHVPAIPAVFALSYGLEGGTAVFERLLAGSWSHYLAAIYLGTISSSFGLLVWSHLMRRYSASAVAPFSLLIPIFGMGSTALFLGESFGPLRLTGSAIVLCGLGLCVVRGKVPVGLGHTPR